MKKSRFIAVVLTLMMLTTMISVGAAAEGEVKLTYYSTSAEVNSMFEEMFVKYHEQNPNVTIELIPTGVGMGQQEQLQSLYASGNAPTFMNIDPANILDYQDKLLVFDESMDWLQFLNPDAIEAGRARCGRARAMRRGRRTRRTCRRAGRRSAPRRAAGARGRRP